MDTSLIQSIVNNTVIPILNFSYNTIYPNYAVGIILLTILVKVALFPLSRKLFQSLKKMQVAQPKLKKIREQYKDNTQKMEEEIIKLYRDNSINPMGGCLPFLIQLPILFALFYTMSSSVFKEMITQPGVFPGLSQFWLPNLAEPDHFYILPIVIGLSIFLGQKLAPASMDKTQQKVAHIMPAILVVICFKMPAGVLLYWAVSQIISTVQQILIMKPVKFNGQKN